MPLKKKLYDEPVSPYTSPYRFLEFINKNWATLHLEANALNGGQHWKVQAKNAGEGHSLQL